MSGQAVQPKGAVYWLDVLDWSAGGGRHYTGHVGWYDDKGYRREEMERHLSLREAKELDPDDGERYWKMRIQRVTNRFETRESLERAAAKWVKTHCKDPVWLLIDKDIHNPHRPIAAQGWDQTRLKLMAELAEAWDKMPDRPRESKPIWDAAYRVWHILIKDHGPLRA